MKQRVREMEQEALKLREMQAEAEAEQNAEGAEGDEDKEAVDSRSVYVGNVRASPQLVRQLTARPRSTTARLRRRSRRTSSRAAP